MDRAPAKVIVTPVKVAHNSWMEETEDTSKHQVPLTPRQKFAMKLLSRGGNIKTEIHSEYPKIPTTPVDEQGMAIPDVQSADVMAVDEDSGRDALQPSENRPPYSDPQSALALRSTKGFLNRVRTAPEAVHVFLPRSDSSLPAECPSPRSRFLKAKQDATSGFDFPTGRQPQAEEKEANPTRPESKGKGKELKLRPVERARDSVETVSELGTPTSEQMRQSFEFPVFVPPPSVASSPNVADAASKIESKLDEEETKSVKIPKERAKVDPKLRLQKLTL
jgi:hypothetical protein